MDNRDTSRGFKIATNFIDVNCYTRLLPKNKQNN